MLPEEKARQDIDRKLHDAGWEVVDRKHYSPTLNAVAVTEGILKGNHEVDYLLFIEGKAIGVIEAKRADMPLPDTATEQAENYAHQLLKWYPYWQKPLPFIYVSNGREIKFRDIRDEKSSYESLPQMHTPKELVRMAGIRSEFAGLPHLSPKGLRKCQFEAVTELEKSFRRGDKRALMVLATGAGKTFTACMAAYRLLTYTPMRRILFLVDRNNLGKQAEGEFGTFRLTETGEPFNTIFSVERLKSPDIPAETNVVISTIQRFFSMLTGGEIEDDDERDDFPEDETEIVLGDDLKLPADYFDLIIVDECHRSIYGRWQKVLSYFNSARIVGLTATPAPETLAFFNRNIIINYTLEKSIADRINVSYRVYRIKTKVTEDGGTIKQDEKITEITKYTGETQNLAAEREIDYSKTELDRSVVNPAQIFLVLDEFKESIYRDLFPERTSNLAYIPKTLVFAKDDAHATRIVEIATKVFPNQTADFVQKITYSAGDSTELIRRFRNEKTFRIAVTVNLVATGTDIRPLEILLFMRDVHSSILYTQMKGRGVRTIGDEQLRNVTPNAISKDLFFLVDAVGVTESEKFVPQPREGKTSALANPTLKQLLEQITLGYLPDYYLNMLASTLSRINAKSNEKHQAEFTTIATASMYDLSTSIFEALEEGDLPAFEDINQPNMERKALVALLANNPQAREYLLTLNAGFVKILVPGEDTLIFKGFSQEEALSATQAFEEYVNTHCDEIEALRIIYNNTNEPITYALLTDLKEKLLSADARFAPLRLWSSYSIIEDSKVIKLQTQTERESLTNLIQLVRYAFKLISELRSLHGFASQRFELWCGQVQRPLTETQKDIMRKIVGYIVSNGTYTNNELREENLTVFAQLVQSFGSAETVNEVLESLSGWMLRVG
ncbi:MAG TPA: DEAD/DEAH box helicase family protein [Bacteroidales bacterium]|jgi:type I restriction enzyme R subunit|nr:DEAD/DEAH box helicase family protein [Bacteroidales bacterium]